MMAEIDCLNEDQLQVSEKRSHQTQEGGLAASFATPKMFQIYMVTKRQLVATWRSPDYVWNKVFLHVYSALFSGFTFWMIGDSSFDLQMRLMTVFNFIFVAPVMINQMQPVYVHNRDVFEAREKKVCRLDLLRGVFVGLLTKPHSRKPIIGLR